MQLNPHPLKRYLVILQKAPFSGLLLQWHQMQMCICFENRSLSGPTGVYYRICGTALHCVYGCTSSSHGFEFKKGQIKTYGVWATLRGKEGFVPHEWWWLEAMGQIQAWHKTLQLQWLYQGYVLLIMQAKARKPYYHEVSCRQNAHHWPLLHL